jgi:hypothetical protein
MNPTNHRKRWTEWQIERLQELVAIGDCLSNICLILQRTPGGVLSKMKSLGVTVYETGLDNTDWPRSHWAKRWG